jgi:hypothetical protein
MQSVEKIPQGKAKFQEIKLVVTDCIRDTDDNSFLLRLYYFSYYLLV